MRTFLGNGWRLLRRVPLTMLCYLSSLEIFPLIFRDSGKVGERQRNIKVRVAHPLPPKCTPTKAGDLTCSWGPCIDPLNQGLYPLSKTG